MPFPAARQFLPEGGYQVGDQARDFKLKNVDGKLVSMADNSKAKGYILVFTCNTCPVSQAYEDRIIALHTQYAAQDYPVIAINPNDPAVAAGDSFDNTKKRADSKAYAFPYLTDETQEVAKAYGARSTPHVFIVSRKAENFVIEYTGAIDNNAEDAGSATKKYVEAAMTDILAGKPAAIHSTKAIGCSIKWRKDN
ncbi:MAG: thioredoxin family protein [Ferruginibacter sp.]|nr:thioredoxin family protein [Cytophagales bacterium]